MPQTVVIYGLQQFYCWYENQQARVLPKSLQGRWDVNFPIDFEPEARSREQKIIALDPGLRCFLTGFYVSFCPMAIAIAAPTPAVSHPLMPIITFSFMTKYRSQRIGKDEKSQRLSSIDENTPPTQMPAIPHKEMKRRNRFSSVVRCFFPIL